MAEHRAKPTAAERRHADLLAFANDPDGFCRDRKVPLSPWVRRLRGRVWAELQQRALDREAGKIYVRFTDPRVWDAIERGHVPEPKMLRGARPRKGTRSPAALEFLGAVRRRRSPLKVGGARFRAWKFWQAVHGVRAELGAKGPRSLLRTSPYVAYAVLWELDPGTREKILGALEAEGCFAVMEARHEPPTEAEWSAVNERLALAQWRASRKRAGRSERDPTDEERARLRKVAGQLTRREWEHVRPYVPVRLERYRRLGRRVIRQVPPGAKAALEPVMTQLDGSLFAPWALCGICGERLTVEDRKTKDCDACRGQFTEKRRWEMRRILAGLPASAVPLVPSAEATEKEINELVLAGLSEEAAGRLRAEKEKARRILAASAPKKEAPGGLICEEIRAAMRDHQPPLGTVRSTLADLHALGRVEVSGGGTASDPERWRLARHRPMTTGLHGPKTSRDLTRSLARYGVPLVVPEDRPAWRRSKGLKRR